MILGSFNSYKIILAIWFIFNHIILSSLLLQYIAIPCFVHTLYVYHTYDHSGLDEPSMFCSYNNMWPAIGKGTISANYNFWATRRNSRIWTTRDDSRSLYCGKLQSFPYFFVQERWLYAVPGAGSKLTKTRGSVGGGVSAECVNGHGARKRRLLDIQVVKETFRVNNRAFRAPAETIALAICELALSQRFRSKPDVQLQCALSRIYG